MGFVKIVGFLSFIVLVHTLPANVPPPPSSTPKLTTTTTYTIDYFLVRKELQYALQDVIAYKEATTSRLDPLPNPPTESENEIRWILDGLRVTAFYAYDKLIFLANSQLLTLAYTTQTFAWYDRVFVHFTNKIKELSTGFDDSVKAELLSLLNQIISQTNQHHYNVKLLLTP
ncbi:hypothetical protein Bhyg_07064 [Pseudolycoriella hygida]|uniref:Uncharacterized protein n=1 Tax=Pseudolycoriella hygida TaxID=35572 RepID=A0A9Q0S316_9DIPT|nr:hypothetical protein Bhyg_07064 [Pseudolycoriella hygida]